MFIDASAIVAILAEEPDSAELAAKLRASATGRYYSAIAVFEAAISLARMVTNLHDGREAPIKPVTIEQTQLHVMNFLALVEAKETAVEGPILDRALDAACRYGKHVGSPARLNLGSCFAYACAKERNVPLLFNGNDFIHTDIERA